MNSNTNSKSSQSTRTLLAAFAFGIFTAISSPLVLSILHHPSSSPILSMTSEPTPSENTRQFPTGNLLEVEMVGFGAELRVEKDSWTSVH